MYIKIPNKIAHIVAPNPDTDMIEAPQTYCGMVIIAHGQYFRESHKGAVCPECQRLAQQAGEVKQKMTVSSQDILNLANTYACISENRDRGNRYVLKDCYRDDILKALSETTQKYIEAVKQADK